MTGAGPLLRAPRHGRGIGATEHGFTLLEMLISLAVIAIAAGATALSLGPRADQAPAIEAQRLVAAIQTAADRSIATGARDILVVGAGGYGIGGARHPLPPEMTLRGPAPAMPVEVDGAPFALTLTAGHARWHIAFDGWQAVAARDDT